MSSMKREIPKLKSLYILLGGVVADSMRYWLLRLYCL